MTIVVLQTMLPLKVRFAIDNADFGVRCLSEPDRQRSIFYQWACGPGTVPITILRYINVMS